MGISISIVAGQDESASSVNASGTVQHVITDEERTTFSLGDKQLKDAVKAHLTKYTGDKSGDRINANMWNGLLRDFIKKTAPKVPPSTGLTEAQVKQLIAETTLTP